MARQPLSLRLSLATLFGMGLSLALPFLGSLAIARFLPGLRFESLPLHSLLESLGALAALIIAGILIAEQSRKPESRHYVWMACALVAMGVLELFHAAAPPGEYFVWLRSTATCVGGVLFLLVWLPVGPFDSRAVRRLPCLVLLGSACLAVCAWFCPDWIGTMTYGDRFSFQARLLHVFGGLGFAGASVFFVLRFHRFVHRDDWLFAVTTQLFAVAAFSFEFSALWDASWWWWHVLRLVAYLAALVFAVAAYVSTESELVLLNLRLTELNRNLDRTVADRTAELRASQERFALAVRGSNDGIWDWNVLTDEVYYSPRFKELLGYADHEMDNVFASFEARLHPDDRQETLDAVRAHLQESRAYDVQYRLRTKTGEYRWFRARGLAVRDSEGRATRMAGSITDITEQKRLQRRFELAVLASPAALLMTDAEGKIVLVNSECARLFGYPRGELVGEPVGRLVPPRFRDALARPWTASSAERHRSDATGDATLTGLRKDGTEFPLEVGLSPVETDDGLAVLYGIVDITARRNTLQAMREAKEAAESANRAKTDFLANMSHEIRTPLHAIIGMTELMLDTDLTESQHEYLSMVMESGELLLAIINEILDLSKIEAGKVKLEQAEFSLRETLGDTMKSLAVRAHRKDLELAYDVAQELPDTLIGDANRLRQIVLNLVGNAIKFTEAGEVVMRVQSVSRSADTVTLRCDVSDTGIGIAEDKLGMIFEAFSQADTSTTRRHGGTGLGLTICSRLVGLMGGQIWVASEVGRGSTFSFTASFGVGPESGQLVRRIELADLRGLHVLVVDDNATNRKILEEVLRHWDLTATAAASADEAFTRMLERQQAGEPFGLVLTDVNMPDGDGFELCERIRNTPELADTVIVVLTSGVRAGDAEKCRQFRVAAQLLKPVKPTELSSTVRTVVSQAVAAGKASLRKHLPALAPQHGLKILVVEDGVMNQKLAVGLLTKWGHSVRVAGNGLEALEAIEHQVFDLVLMDIQMPIMNGFETTAAIRQRELASGEHIPIIAMTAHALKGDRDTCLAAGMDGYVAKPMRQQELFEAIQAVVPRLGRGQKS